jgi:hypothetical protein
LNKPALSRAITVLAIRKRIEIVNAKSTIEAVHEFGALTDYDEFWLVDSLGRVAECGSLVAHGEIWRVTSPHRITAVVAADQSAAGFPAFRDDGSRND